MYYLCKVCYYGPKLSRGERQFKCPQLALRYNRNTVLFMLLTVFYASLRFWIVLNSYKALLVSMHSRVWLAGGLIWVWHTSFSVGKIMLQLRPLYVVVYSRIYTWMCFMEKMEHDLIFLERYMGFDLMPCEWQFMVWSCLADRLIFFCSFV